MKFFNNRSHYLHDNSPTSYLIFPMSARLLWIKTRPLSQNVSFLHEKLKLFFLKSSLEENKKGCAAFFFLTHLLAKRWSKIIIVFMLDDIFSHDMRVPLFVLRQLRNQSSSEIDFWMRSLSWKKKGLISSKSESHKCYSCLGISINLRRVSINGVYYLGDYCSFISILITVVFAPRVPELLYSLWRGSSNTMLHI